MVIAATDRHRGQHRGLRRRRARGRCSSTSVDVPPLCNFILPAIVRSGPLAIAISTAGASPALAKRMKREIAGAVRRGVRAARGAAQRGARLGQGDAADLPGAQGVLRGDRQRRARPGGAAARGRRAAGEAAVRELIASAQRAHAPAPSRSAPAWAAAPRWLAWRARAKRCDRGLTRRYGEREALGGRVAVAASAAQTLVVLGPNGAGKTTLLRVLATLLRPHAGEVRRARAHACRTRPGRCAGGSGCSATSRCSTAS